MTGTEIIKSVRSDQTEPKDSATYSDDDLSEQISEPVQTDTRSLEVAPALEVRWCTTQTSLSNFTEATNHVDGIVFQEARADADNRLLDVRVRYFFRE